MRSELDGVRKGRAGLQHKDSALLNSLTQGCGDRRLKRHDAGKKEASGRGDLLRRRDTATRSRLREGRPVTAERFAQRAIPSRIEQHALGCILRLNSCAAIAEAALPHGEGCGANRLGQEFST